MKKLHIITVLIILISITTVHSQVSINTDGSDAATSAMLDVVSTSKGMLVPRMTTTQRNDISNAANGLLVFDETTSSFWFYKTGTGWEELTSGSSVSTIDALNDAASDAYNVFIGTQSGANNTGQYNSAIGIRSLTANTTGNYNTASGYEPLRVNSTGTRNTASGALSLSNNTTGQENVAYGAYSLAYNQEGSNNTAIGYNAGRGSGLQNMSGNIFIGNNAGFYAAGDNKLYIDNSNTTTPLIGGDFASNYININGNLNVIGNIKITGGSPGADKVLTSDADGNATWENNSASAAMGIDDLSDGISDGVSVFLGTNSGSNDDGSNNYNTGIGSYSLDANTSGIKNTGIGYHALTNNTTGYDNVGIGTSSLDGNISGTNNIGIGFQSLHYNQHGDRNTIIGYQAGFGSSSYNNQSGNIFIGYQAGYNEHGNNKLYIDNSNTPNPLIGGDFGTNEVNIYGTLKIAGGSPASGKVLTSDANGKASWENLGDLSISIDDLTDGISDGVSVFLGTNSGLSDDGSDNYNTGVGSYSLDANTSGIKNTGLGYHALTSNTTGYDNVGIGTNSLDGNISGTYNIGIGFQSLHYNQHGDRNTIIGYQAGFGSSSYNNQSGNIFIGYQAGYYEHGSNKLYIDNSNTPNPLIGGDFGTNEVYIYGTLKIAGGSPGLNKVLTSDANGNATWETTGVPASMAIDDLSDASSDANNIFLGSGSGSNNTAPYNAAVGINSLAANTSGINNTAFGYNALLANSSGASNTAIGAQSSINCTVGSGNVSLGHSALAYNKEGNYNTAVGFQAGHSSANQNISGNVFLGYQAGYQETGDNKLYIENSLSTTPLIGGDFSTDQVDINGTIKITGGSPGVGKFLTSDADGLASWQDGSALSMEINDLTDAASDGSSIFLGDNAGNNDDGSNGNIAIGLASMINNTSGQGNIAIGGDALKNNQTGSHNTAIGLGAGWGTSSTHSKSGGVFIGNQAGYNELGSNKLYISNSSTSTPLIGGDFSIPEVDINGDLNIIGSVNITDGTQGANKVLTSDANGNATWENTGVPAAMSIDDLTDGKTSGNSVFLGTSTGQNDDGTDNYNTAIGYQTLTANTNGYLNTANGYQALFKNTIGFRNTATGTFALYDNISGDYNTSFGGYSLRYATNNRNTAVGYFAGPGSANASLYNTTAIGYYAAPTRNNEIVLGNSSVDYIGGYAFWSNLSDKRFKNQIKENVAGLDFIMKLRPITYHLDVAKLDEFLGVEEENPDMKSKRAKEAIQQTGFIAQEVEQAAKDVNYNFSGVGKPQNENDHYSIAYAEFVVPLVKAVQEQQAQIEAQQAMIEQMQLELKNLKKQSK